MIKLLYYPRVNEYPIHVEMLSSFAELVAARGALGDGLRLAVQHVARSDILLYLYKLHVQLR